LVANFLIIQCADEYKQCIQKASENFCRKDAFVCKFKSRYPCL